MDKDLQAKDLIQLLENARNAIVKAKEKVSMFFSTEFGDKFAHVGIISKLVGSQRVDQNLKDFVEFRKMFNRKKKFEIDKMLDGFFNDMEI